MQALELLSSPAAAVTTAAAGNVLEKGFFKATSTHSRMQSPRMTSAGYDTLCNVVVRKQRDFGHFFLLLRSGAVSPAAAADVRENGMAIRATRRAQDRSSLLMVNQTRTPETQTPQRV